MMTLVTAICVEKTGDKYIQRMLDIVITEENMYFSCEDDKVTEDTEAAFVGKLLPIINYAKQPT